jgi:diaminopimelate epimerase
MVPAATDEITVHMDGGDAKVRVGQPSPGRVTLAGPATFIATIEAEC